MDRRASTGSAITRGKARRFRMDQVHQFLLLHRAWIYPATVLFTFLEGETFVLFAAAASASGLIDPIKLGGCAWLGSYLGDQCWFFVGRVFGPMVLRRRPGWKHGIDAVHRWLERWDTLFILTFRFLYGVRNFSSVALGLSDIGARRFMVLNFVGAGIWTVAFVGAGALFGHTIVKLLGDWAQTIELIAAGVFLVGVLVVMVVGRWRVRRARRVALLPAERL